MADPGASAGASEPSLGQRAILGLSWNLLGTGVKIGTRLAALVVIARELTPVDFAIAGLGLTAIAFFNVLTTRGFAQALIQRSTLDQDTQHSVFWVVAAGGVAMGGLAFAGAAWVSGFYEQPALVEVVRVLAAGLLFTLLGSVPRALLQRQMRFKALNLVDMICGLLAAGAGIVMALMGYGYHSLILPGVAAALIQSMALFPLAGYRPSLRFSWAKLKGLSAFGLSELGSGVVLFLNDNSDYLILGRFWAPAVFGQYFFAFERSRQPFQLLYPQLSSVLFPSFSRIQTDHARLRKLFLMGTRMFCLLMFPLFLLLVGLADPLLPLVFGSQWQPAVPVFRLFSAWMLFRCLVVMVPPMLLALDRAQINLVFNLFRFALLLPALLLLGYWGADILTAALVLVAIWLLQLPFYLFSLLRIIALKAGEIWRDLRVVLVSSLAMLAGLGLMNILEQVCDFPDWVVLSFGSTVPLAIYGWLARSEIRKALAEVRRVAGSSREQQAAGGDQHELL